MDKFKLFDAEYKFLTIIWDMEPVNSTELSKICVEKLGWKKSTTYNMIRKLAERGVRELLSTYRSGSFLVNITNVTSLSKLIRAFHPRIITKTI